MLLEKNSQLEYFFAFEISYKIVFFSVLKKSINIAIIARKPRFYGLYSFLN